MIRSNLPGIVRRTCFFTLFVFCVSAHSHAQGWSWVKSAGQPLSHGTNDGEAKNVVNGLGMDKHGNLYASGLFRDFIKLGNCSLTTHLHSYGVQEVFVCKMDSMGEVLWAKQISGQAGHLVYGMWVDENGNVYIIGATNHLATFDAKHQFSPIDFDMYIAKYNTNGDVVWVKCLGGRSSDFGQSIVGDNNGSLYFTGYFSDTLNMGSKTLKAEGGQDFFVAKMDTSGAIQWVQQGGGAGRDEGMDIALDKAGSLLVSGHFSEKATFGTIELHGTGYRDQFIAKYETNGAFKWARAIDDGINDQDYVLNIAADSKGNAYLSGAFKGRLTLDQSTFISSSLYIGYLVKYSANGEVLWERHFNDIAESNMAALYVDEYDSIYVSGYFSGTCALNENVFSVESGSLTDYDTYVLKMDDSGTIRWGTSVNGSGSSYARTVLRKKNKLYLGGMFIGEAGFGSLNYDSEARLPLTWGFEDLYYACYDFDKASTTVGLKEAAGQAAGIQVYPNPNNGTFRVRIEKDKIQHIEVYSVNGEKVFETDGSGQQADIKLPDEMKGMYYLKVHGGNNVSVSKMMVW